MNELQIKIIDHIVFSSEPDNWNKSKRKYDLSNCAGIEVIIQPSDAKDISEVESFIVTEDVMGSITQKYTRKKSHERPKKNTENTQ